ncbi:peptidylprolyl isomerase [Psychroflexus salis]|uniref:peptidylprolyl isomerase n=1 Tax=Psychroflexus salis TaxID=1526574 RepID=A0A916ZY65_9FLAO|nr:peptidylprolyl isomerase [Psychroflexus salis]GGE16720.1 peptidyl-prolyl cis-trans isomerase [Psychroflexus salis]
MLKLKIFVMLFSMGILNTGCDPYPNLEEGLYAEFETSQGNFTVELHHDKAPLTVANFVALAEGTHPQVDKKYKGKLFYDGIIFHRVIENFMIQGGDPSGTGQGGPGYKFADEVDTGLTHDAEGILSMANAGPGTNGSQFFITLAPTPHLNGKHSVFGKVDSGMEIVKKIGSVETGKADKPTEDVVIKKVKIIRKGNDAKSFDASKIFSEELEKMEAKKQEAMAAKQKVFDEASEGFEETASGLRFLITKANDSGKQVKTGDLIKVHYTGQFLDGEIFDSSLKREEPIKFNVGTGKVIPGWDEGLQLLKVGEKATLLIPSELAYGSRGVGPIPPNTPLKFEVELIEIVED